MSSIKRNLAYNLINTVSSIIFPIITLPYVLRVLLPEGIGTLDFLNSFITYITLFTSLGIPVYAVKEVAKCRDNKTKMAQTTLEIMQLTFWLTLLGYIAVLIIGFFIPKVAEHKTLFFVLSSGILLNTIGVGWFFQAIEEFAFIVKRALVIRVLGIIALFVFVKTQDDLLIYALIGIVGSVGSNILNFIKLHRYIPFSKDYFYRKPQMTRHIKPALELFVMSLIISIYVNLDTLMLGFMKNNTDVGYYSTAVKFYRLILMVVTALGGVLLPRMANIIERKDNEEFKRLSIKSIHFTMFLGMPMTLGLILLAEPIIMIFGGVLYQPSILTLQILSPIIILVGITNVIGIQMLYPLDKQRLVIYSVSGGAIINLILNLIFIPKYSMNGAAFSTFIAEVIVLVIQLYYLNKYINFRLFDKSTFNYLLGSICMGLVVWSVSLLSVTNLINLIISIVLGSVTYLSFLLIIKDAFFSDLYIGLLENKIVKKIRQKWM